MCVAEKIRINIGNLHMKLYTSNLYSCQENVINSDIEFHYRCLMLIIIFTKKSYRHLPLRVSENFAYLTKLYPQSDGHFNFKKKLFYWKNKKAWMRAKIFRFAKTKFSFNWPINCIINNYDFVVCIILCLYFTQNLHF